MKFQAGDLVFTRNGVSSLVTGRHQNDQTLLVEKNGENYERARRYGYVNGMDPRERKDYEVIIDEVRKEPTPLKQVEKLKEKIDELPGDPQNLVLKRYLESEMSHIMNSERVRPRQYELREEEIL